MVIKDDFKLTLAARAEEPVGAVVAMTFYSRCFVLAPEAEEEENSEKRWKNRRIYPWDIEVEAFASVRLYTWGGARNNSPFVSRPRCDAVIDGDYWLRIWEARDTSEGSIPMDTSWNWLRSPSSPGYRS